MVEKYYRPREGNGPRSHKLAERLYHNRRSHEPSLSQEEAAEKISQAGYPTTGDDWRAVESTDAFPINGKGFAKAYEESGQGNGDDVENRHGYDVLHDRFGERVKRYIQPPEDLSHKQ